MRVENKLPASISSAGVLKNQMLRYVEFVGYPVYVIENKIKRTWSHELDHYFNDEGKIEFGGNFGFSLEISVSDEFVFASWVAYYEPFGPDYREDPERWMKIAQGPGFQEMSDQDRKIYDAAWRAWWKKMQEEKYKAQEKGNVDEEKNPKIPLLIAVPRKDKESDDEYKKHVRFVQIFTKRIPDLMKRRDGLTPTMEENFPQNVIKFMYDKKNMNRLIAFYIEAKREIEFEMKNDNGDFQIDDLNNEKAPEGFEVV